MLFKDPNVLLNVLCDKRLPPFYRHPASHRNWHHAENCVKQFQNLKVNDNLEQRSLFTNIIFSQPSDILQIQQTSIQKIGNVTFAVLMLP